MPLEKLSHSGLTFLAGNGMNVACAGVLIIIVAVHVQKIKGVAVGAFA